MAPPSNAHRKLETTGRLQVEGGALAYDVAGAGPAVLLLHAFIADRRMWNREFASYARDHRVVRVDLRGWGGSTAATSPFSYVRDLEQLVERLKLERPMVVAGSMGGAIALDYALAHPKEVRGLLLAAPGVSGGFEGPYSPEELAAFEEDNRQCKTIDAAWKAADPDLAFEGLRTLWCAALSGENLALFRRMVQENTAEVYDNRSQAKAEPGPPAAARLPGLNVPTTILVGNRDNPSSPVIARRIAGWIPGSRLRSLPDADHLINLSAPEEFDREFRALARSTG